ncbi:itaconate degradation C-C-lyase RipC [Inquilinus sp. YAF38]|uniref:itaconate degradation C-C-lyase RipC n=1 Tax=Inquilinus sp. YAF38 TaxID=3233084 RepID=UPI003F93E59C
MAQDRSRPMRSWLFTPATRPDRFAKAAEAGADVLIIDLEDAVAPADKPRARAAALGHLAAPAEAGPLRALRVNGLDTRAGLADLDALLGSAAAPDILVLPKAEGTGHLQILDRLLTAAGKAARLVGIIESARGLVAAEAIAAATPRLAGLMLGAADMAADLGAATAWEPLARARSRLVAACALAGVTPIDSPFFDLKDEAGLEREAAASVALGFAAKAAIHPAQLQAINRALTPTPDQVETARAILAENAKGVGTVGGLMIDEAVARKARRVLAAAGLTTHPQT